MKNEFCRECHIKEICDTTDEPCNAVKALTKLCVKEFTQVKRELLMQYARELNIIDFEVSDELKELGEKVISKRLELHFINEYDIKVGYVISYEAKRDKGRSVNADCRKVNGPYQAYLPFDFVITFYEPNVYHMSDNQKKILMLHELRHIGIGMRGLRIENHDIEDFYSLLKEFGMQWNEYQQDVIDILAGGDSESGSEVKTKEKNSKKK
jgi:predicted metallopeptidase